MRASPVETTPGGTGERDRPEGTGRPPPYGGGRSPGAPSRKRSTRARAVRRCKGPQAARRAFTLAAACRLCNRADLCPAGPCGSTSTAPPARAAHRRRRWRRPHRREVGAAVRAVWLAARHRSTPQVSTARGPRTRAGRGRRGAGRSFGPRGGIRLAKPERARRLRAGGLLDKGGSCGSTVGSLSPSDSDQAIGGVRFLCRRSADQGVAPLDPFICTYSGLHKYI